MSDLHENDPLSPVLTITSGPLPDVGVVLVRFDFVDHAHAPALGQAHAGRNYVLTPVQARHLVERLQKSLTRLDGASVVDLADTVH
jgi:BssS protein family